LVFEHIFFDAALVTVVVFTNTNVKLSSTWLQGAANDVVARKVIVTLPAR
jgi:BarA-like signal transduction histidine kinase